MKKRLLTVITLSLFLIAITSVYSMGATDGSLEKLFSYSGNEFERGITVLPNGNIYTITAGGNLVGFKPDGTVTFQTQLESQYCGNLCSDSNGYIFAHTYTGNAAIYVFKPESGKTCKTLWAGDSCQALAVGDDGYLYKLNGVAKSGRKVAAIKRAKLKNVETLADNEDINWEKTYYPKYTPINKDGNCYPAALDVKNGYAYIGDKGSSSGYDSSVSGIYRYSFGSDELKQMNIDAKTVKKITWLHAIAADQYGNVAVVGRNSNTIAIYRNSSTVASMSVNTKGYCEDIATDNTGNFIFSSSKNVNYGNSVYKITLENSNIPVISVTVTPKSKKVVKGTKFTLSAAVEPKHATNKKVTYSSSNTKVATVNSGGTVTAKSVGKTEIKAETTNGKTAVCKVSVVPENAVISKLTAGSKTLTVKMSKKASSCSGDGFQIAYRIKGTSKWLTTTTTSQSKKISTLKKGKKYNVKARTYKKVGNIKYYGNWSPVKTSNTIKK